MQQAQIAEELKNQAVFYIKKIKNKEELFHYFGFDKSNYKNEIEQFAFESPQDVQSIIEYLQEQDNTQMQEQQQQIIEEEQRRQQQSLKRKQEAKARAKAEEEEAEAERKLLEKQRIRRKSKS